jgi:hypothetical protein
MSFSNELDQSTYIHLQPINCRGIRDASLDTESERESLAMEFRMCRIHTLQRSGRSVGYVELTK